MTIERPARHCISIAAEYTTVPGPRYIAEGEHSGEEFRTRLLLPRFLAARDAGQRLRVEFDGVRYGYPTSFLEEAFGGLARLKNVGIGSALEWLELHSDDEPTLVDEVRNYIKNADKTSKQRAAVR